MDNDFKNMRPKYIIGIDEVGRGALAGPVTVGVVALRMGIKFKPDVLKNLRIKLRDSKKLNPKMRERWVKYLKERGDIPFGVASVSPKIIDRMNISQAANLAATRAFLRLADYSVLKTKPLVFLDGGLYLKRNWGKKLKVRTVIRGDQKIDAIKLASIVAKVHRDKLMTRRHKKYPRYSFPKHKGYGTALHMESLKRHGLSEIHRKSFCRNFI
ncbi:ribonuclease HII [bacterium]|nr:MAG: ribonuclease HII [bacterium]